jgi:hypothetical protein
VDSLEVSKVLSLGPIADLGLSELGSSASTTAGAGKIGPGGAGAAKVGSASGEEGGVAAVEGLVTAAEGSRTWVASRAWRPSSFKAAAKLASASACVLYILEERESEPQTAADFQNEQMKAVNATVPISPY